jgi:hypothetical protein
MAVTPAIARLVTDELRRFLRRKTREYAFFALAALAALATIGYLIAAAYDAIARRTDPITADFILAGSMAVLAVVLAAIGLIFARKPKREKIMASAAVAGLPLAAGLLGRRIPWTVIGAGAAAVVALALGRAIARKD